MRTLSLLLALGLTTLLPACATITRGTTEVFKVQTVPEGAAIRTSNGHSCPTTPCEFKVKRSDKFTVFAEKAGYKPSSLDILTEVSGKGMAGMAGNVIAGGLIGMAVDSGSGAMLNHTPNPAILTLEPLAPAKATQAPKKHTAKTEKPVS